MKKLLFLTILLSVGRTYATTYYSQVTGTQDMNVLTKWNTNPGGAGSNPSNLTSSGDLFIIQAAHNITLSASLVFGSGVDLQISGSLTPDAFSLTVGGVTKLVGSGSYFDWVTSGTNTFVGFVTLTTTGSWLSTSNAATPNVIFNGGITNTSGTFNSGNASLGAGTTITPTTAMAFTGNLVCSGNLTIANGQLVTNTLGLSNIAGDFTIGTGGFTRGNQGLTVGGMVTTYGPWNSSCGVNALVFRGGVTNNSSSTFTCTNALFNANATNQDIAGTGAFTFSGQVNISSNKTVTNLCSHANGVTISGTLNGLNASSEWINGSNTLLNYTTTTTIANPMVTGKLTATASGNFVSYNRSGSTQNIKTTTYANLRISGGGTKVLQAPIDITESLDMVNGIVTATITKYITLNNGSSATVGNSSSYVDGVLRYDMAYAGNRTLNFPIGKGADWRPVSLNVTHSSSTAYSYRSESFNNSALAFGYSLPPTVSNVSKAHYWNIGRFIGGTNTRSASANLSGNPVITLYYGLNDNVPDAANLTICKNTDAAPTTWFDIGGTGATNFSGSVTSTSSPTAFVSFSIFTLGNRKGGTNPLPVTLVSFTANCNVSHTVLEWTTATEINNNYFNVEASLDGKSWNTVNTITGAGNSSKLVNYSCTVPTQANSTLFYRLKQTDFDGKFEYSDVIIVKDCKTSTGNRVSVYPNPSNGVINLQASNTENLQSINIYNTIGNLVYSSQEFQSQIDLSSFPKGIYFVQFNQLNAASTVQKVVLEK